MMVRMIRITIKRMISENDEEDENDDKDYNKDKDKNNDKD